MAIIPVLVPPPLSSRTDETAAERTLGRSLVQALQEGQMVEARALIEAGADVNYHLRGDGTPLVIAARFGSRDMVQYLIEHGADVNQPAPGDGNPLIMASMFGHLDVARLLVERGANVNGVVAGSGHLMMERAAEYAVRAVGELLRRGARSLDVTEAALDRFVAWVDAGNRRMAWGQDYISNWYQNAAGRVVTIWP